MLRVIACCFALLLATFSQQEVARVLFIGNSLTTTNDLPGMVEALAEQARLRGRIVCRAVAKPNFGLEEHWTDGEALRAIRSARWTHVVLQQGPSSLPESRRVLREYTKKFADAAHGRGARVVLYGVWPPRDRLAFQKDVTESYRQAATDVGGELIAVGDAWRWAWQRDPKLPLYGWDGFHPSQLGTYLAALMFLERLTGTSPVGLPSPRESRSPVLRQIDVAASALSVVQQAATTR